MEAKRFNSSIRLVLLMLCLFGLKCHADNHGYHGEFEYTYTDTRFPNDSNDDGKGRSHYVSARFYPWGVPFTSSWPNVVSPFYGRHTAINIGRIKTDQRDLNQVRGGRVLDTAEYDSYLVGARIAKPDNNLWLAINYLKNDDSTLDFSDGNSVTAVGNDEISVQVGYFFAPNIGAYLLYQDQLHDRFFYQLGWHGLIELSNGHYIELTTSYRNVEHNDRLQLEVVNNTIRNLDLSGRREHTWNFGSSYFINKELRFGGRYTRTSISFDGIIASNTFLADYTLNNGLQLTLEYSLIVPNDSVERSSLYRESTSLSAGIGLRF